MDVRCSSVNAIVKSETPSIDVLNFFYYVTDKVAKLVFHFVSNIVKKFKVSIRSRPIN